MHHDNRTPTRRKHLKGSPNGRPRDYSRSVIGLNVKLKSGLIMAIPHHGLPPLIATQIDQYANQPGFLSFKYRTARNLATGRHAGTSLE